MGFNGDWMVLETIWIHLMAYTFWLFPRASGRRVLLILIVGVCQTFSHIHMFTWHLQIFTSFHLHIFSSSHLLIFTSVHLHIFSFSHLLIFTSSHLHTCSFSHLLIFTSVNLHIFSSSHPHICSSSHLHIFTFSLALLLSCPLASSHLHLTSSHLLIFTSSHLHIFTSSHLHILSSLLPSCSLALLLSCPLALSFFSISLLKARGSANETARNATLSHEMRFDRQKLL